MRRAYHGTFTNLSFPKKGKEIKGKILGMVKELRAKIQEREARVGALAKEMKMDTSMDVLMNFDKLSDDGYSNSGPEITVGKTAALRQEIGAMKAQTEEVERLESILRNLPDKDTFTLSFDELTYFGF